MTNNINHISAWERQENESEPAFQAFVTYRDKGLDRTLISVSQELHKSYTLIRRWADTWSWSERVREYDNELERKAKKEAEKQRKDMYTRHAKIATTFQKKAMEALNELDPKMMSAKSIREFIEMATELERQSRAMAVEEYEKEDEATNSSVVIICDIPRDTQGDAKADEDKR